MTKTLNAYIDMSGSTVEDDWLPELAAELGEWLHGVAEPRAVRLIAFSHELGEPMLMEGDEVGPQMIEQMLGAALKDLIQVSGGTSLETVWADAVPRAEAGEDVVVLTDMEMFVPGPGRAQTHEAIRYRQYGVQDARQRSQEDERSARLRQIADAFLAEHGAAHGFLPQEKSLRSPTEEEATKARAAREQFDLLLAEQEARQGAQGAQQPQGDVDDEQEKDSAEIASETGFAGSLGDFLEWLGDALVYGHVNVSDPMPDRWGRLRVEVSTVTGGFSSDEHLLARVDALVEFRMGWRSSHAGGLRKYRFSAKALRESTIELAPEAEEPHETYHRARKIRVVSPNGKYVEVLEGYAHGVELWGSEEPFDPSNPAGVLTIRPVPEERSVWS